jgi:hypothetical protein
MYRSLKRVIEKWYPEDRLVARYKPNLWVPRVWPGFSDTLSLEVF